MTMPAVAFFKGAVPRAAKRKLPAEVAEDAINCRVRSGDLECFKNFELEATLAKGANVNTIYPLEDALGETVWLQWKDSELASGAVEVDVAKSTSSDDGRVFLTGLDIPRWTNLSLATQSGSDQYPVVTRPLGVPNPSSAPSVTRSIALVPPTSVVDDFTNPSNWTLVPEFNNGTAIRRAEILSTGGNPGARLVLTAQQITTGGLGAVYAYRDCGIGSSVSVEYSFDFKFDNAHTPFNERNAAAYVMCDAQGNGPRFGFGTNGPSAFTAALSLGTSWAQGGSTISLVNVSSIPAVGSWVRVTITGERRPNGNYDFRMVVQQGSAAPMIDTTFENVPVSGGYCGHLIAGSLNADRGPIITSVSDVFATGSSAPEDTSDDVNTSYVYTFVNDLGEESGPSEASATIARDAGTTVTITTPTSPPSGVDYFIETKRIYRAATSAGGTAFFFVAEIPLATATYQDTLTDAQLGEELETTDYALPPSDLRGILALPNDIYVGFRQDSNDLCLSVQGRPHAWPVAFRLKTDEPIVAIGNVDTVVCIATKAFTYTAAGTAPDNYAMTKSEVRQGCVSKRGCGYLKGYGWVFPSGDGLVALAGVGQPQLITSALYTRREWQQLSPETLIAVVHDDMYFGFYEDCNDNKRGILLDVNEGQFGQVTLWFHAIACFSWAKDDTLYLVLDENITPSTESPQTDGQVVPDGQTIYKFDTYCEGLTLTKYLPRQWVSKKWEMGGDVPLMCRVRATDYASVRLILYNQGWPYYTVDVASNAPFRLPKLYTIEQYFQFAIQGTSFVQSVEFGYDAEDFAP